MVTISTEDLWRYAKICNFDYNGSIGYANRYMKLQPEDCIIYKLIEDVEKLKGKVF